MSATLNRDTMWKFFKSAENSSFVLSSPIPGRSFEIESFYLRPEPDSVDVRGISDRTSPRQQNQASVDARGPKQPPVVRGMLVRASPRQPVLSNYLEETAKLVTSIHTSRPVEEGILVFLPGERDR